MKRKIRLIIVLVSLGLLAFFVMRTDLIRKYYINSESNSILEQWRSDFELVHIKSPLDDELQPALFYKTKSRDPKPLLVSLHSWSSDYTQYDSINEFSFQKDFNYIHPNFRGPNNHNDACCSELVISDIDAAISYALENANVDASRIYVIGMSGGGYATLTMFMKSKHKINKFSSWVPLSDLIQWYKEAQEKGMKYDDEILSCTNSENGILNKQIAKERSPLYMDTPIHKFEYSQMEIYAGINDKTIPFTHSTNFYNKLVNDLMVTDSTKYVTYNETLDILQNRNPLGRYHQIADRKVILKKEIGNLKLILFDGGHEILQRYAFDQLFE